MITEERGLDMSAEGATLAPRTASINLARKRDLVTFLESVLALVAGAAFFTVCGLVAWALPDDGSGTVIVFMLAISFAAVVTTAALLGIAYAVPVGIAGAVALDWNFIPPTHDSLVPGWYNLLALAAYLGMGVLLGQVAARALRRARAAEQERGALAEEQAALRRVATLVAQQSTPEQVFAAVTDELRRLLALDIIHMLRYEWDGSAVVVAGRSAAGDQLPEGARLTLSGDDVASRVRTTGAPSRVDQVRGEPGELEGRLRSIGARSMTGSPIVVDGSLWGVMIAASTDSVRIPDATQGRVDEFTDLIATVIANAEARTELSASRARVISAGDSARRRLERDLHDGVQQRLVATALDVRRAANLAGTGDDDLNDALARIGTDLITAIDELREVAHGIHPTILSNGGIKPALASLVRRSGLPAQLAVSGARRLPDAIESTVYYVVSEALTNAAKHARASTVDVTVAVGSATVEVLITDDGVGGADLRHGSGLIGLRDRVEAVGGSIEMDSPIGVGTTLRVQLPATAPGGVRP